MRTTYSISFYCRKSKTDRQGTAPIELSIIINGQRRFINCPLKCSPEEFNRKRRPRYIQDYVDTQRVKVATIVTEMATNGIPLTTEALREYIRSGGVKSYTIKDLFTDYFKLLEKKVDHGITYVVYTKYCHVRDRFYELVDKDKEVTTITPAVIQEFYARLKQRYQDSTSGGMMTKLKAVITYALDNNHLKVNPFQNIKITKGQPKFEYLTEEEIQTLVNKHFDIDRLEKVKDLAVFQIASGMSYIDTQQLRPDDIHYEEDGTCYIHKERMKTGVKYTSVVFPEGVAVLHKYNNQLPSITNQKGNAYLKEIQTICGITKTLHFHLFRKTYGTRLLNKGVRLETVSKCLGHSNTQITSSTYAKLLKQTIIDEVKQAFI